MFKLKVCIYLFMFMALHTIRDQVQVKSKLSLITTATSTNEWVYCNYNNKKKRELKRNNLEKKTQINKTISKILRVFHSVREKVVHSGYVEVYED